MVWEIKIRQKNYNWIILPYQRTESDFIHFVHFGKAQWKSRCAAGCMLGLSQMSYVMLTLTRGLPQNMSCVSVIHLFYVYTMVKCVMWLFSYCYSFAPRNKWHQHIFLHKKGVFFTVYLHCTASDLMSCSFSWVYLAMPHIYSLSNIAG